MLVGMFLGACDEVATKPAAHDTQEPQAADTAPPAAADSGLGGGDSGETMDSGDARVGDPAEDCHASVSGWPSDSSAVEVEVLRLVNAARAAGADCGEEGVFAPAPALVMEPALRCAARFHSGWMAAADTMSHDSPGGALGDDPWERMAQAGFTGDPLGENVAAGYPDATAVMDGWMGSDGHCANVMSADARLLGVGHARGGSHGHYWTQAFGR